MSSISLCSSSVSNITVISNIFIDKYMPSANGSFVKVYLYLLRIMSDNSTTDLSISKIADNLEHTETDVLRALTYWEKLHLLSLRRNPKNEIDSITFHDLDTIDNTPAFMIGDTYQSDNSFVQNEISTTVATPKLQDNKDINFVISIAEKYIERMLTPNDEQLILYLYTKAGFSPDLILELYEYCASQGKKQYRYIEAVASAWIKDGIKSAEQARTTTDTYISNYKAVVNEFGITRQLGQSEKNYIDKWSKTYGFNIEIIKKACSKTLLSIQKPDFKYTDKILAAWHQNNVKTLQDLETLENNYQRSNSQKKTKQYSTPKTNNKFNSFSQRNYTSEELDELERKLLSK
ncbi:MAG: DnaD domain protein [Lachnospiraceae bacterium]|nr:DnaD domain protein [Lachnospiraceae bacterium]